MSKTSDQLHHAYRVESLDETRAFYQGWAASYDAEIAKNGYATPRRCAIALARFSPDLCAPVLDFGCGTGLSGVALRNAGFRAIDGCDISSKMLKKARARDGVYRKLRLSNPDAPLSFPSGSYAHIAAMGVIAAGHAPAETIDLVLAALTSGGLFVFSLNDHTLQDPAFEARIAENIDTGTARLLFKEHGDHLPGIGLQSTVYVLEKA